MATQIYKVWADCPPDFIEQGGNEEQLVELHEFNDDFINLERVKELIGDNCKIAQPLPGTEYTMWCDEESKLKHDCSQRGNPFGTQAWQDSAAGNSGWDWLYQHYGGFIWDHDLAVGKVVQIMEGEFEDDDMYISNGVAIHKNSNLKEEE